MASDRNKMETSVSGWRVPTLHRDTASHGVATNALSLATVTSFLRSGPEIPHH